MSSSGVSSNSDFTGIDTGGVEVQNEPESIGAIPTANQPVLSPTTQQTFGNAITYGLPGLGAGLIDTLGQSIGVFHNDTVPNVLKTFTGEGENSFGDFYARNQQPLRTGGELAGMLLPGLAAMRVLKSVQGAREAGQLGAFLKNSVAADVLLGSSADLTASEAKITSEVSKAVTDQGVWAGKTVQTPEILAAKRSYYATRAVDAARTTVAWELGNRAAFSSSSTFYPADYTLTDQLKWSGLGLVGGVALDLAAAKYAVRNIIQATTKQTVQEYAALAPNDIAEYGLLRPSPLTSSFGKDIDKVLFRPNDRGVGITQFAALSADLKDTASVSAQRASLQTSLAQDQVNIDAVLNRQIRNGFYDVNPLKALPRANPTDDQVALALKATQKNNTALVAMTSLHNVPEGGPVEFYKGVQNELEEAQKQYQVDTFVADGLADPQKKSDGMMNAIAKVAPIEQAASQMHYVLEGDGNWSVYRNRADNWLDNHNFDDIKRKTYTTPDQVNGQNVTLKNSKLLAKGTNDLVLHDNFRAEVPKGATPIDFSTLYAMGSKLISDWKPVEGQTFVLTPQVDWRTLEMTSALAKAQPQAKSAIQLGNDFTSLDDVDFHVLNQKFQDFQSLMPDTSRIPPTGLAARMAAARVNYTPAQVIQRLNLPTPLSLQSSPVVEMFAHAKLQGMTDLNEMFPLVSDTLTPSPFSKMDLVQQHLRNIVGETDQTKQIPVAGNLLKQTDTKPVFVAANTTPWISRADANIAGMVQAKRDVQLERLAQINPKVSPLVSNVINKIVTASKPAVEGGELSGAANQARAVQTLQDGLVSGTGQVVYQDRINEQFATLKAAQLLAQDGDKFVDNYVATLAKGTVTPLFADLLSHANRQHLFDFNRIEQAYRHGWDISSVERSPTGAGMVFKLKGDSPVNKQLQAYHFPGEELDEEGNGFNYLPDMSVTAKKKGYQPLVVSQKASDLANAISEMSKQSGRENNALRLALGKNPVTIRDFHLPTPELEREGTFFVRNGSGRVIATYTGSNFGQNKTRAQEAANALNSTTADTQHVAIPLDTVRADHQVNDDNFFSIIDYSDQLAKSGAGIRGGLAHTEIDTGDTTVRAMVKSLQTQFLNVGIRSRAAVFEPELNYARQASATAKAAGQNSKLGGINIFDRYISTMFSQSPNTNKGTLGMLYGGAEDAMDRALSWANAHFTELTGSQSNVAGAIAMRRVLRGQSSEEEFNQFKKVLPSWSPFQETSDWAESTFKQKPQWTARPIAASLSKLSSTMSLRFLDVGTAINNFAGLLTNTPSLMYALRKGPAESHEQWLDRTGAYGSQISDGVMTFSPMKALNVAIKALWNGELSEPMANAAKHGYFEPEYASLTKALTLPQTPSQQALHNFFENGSKLADRSETMSRQIAWGLGYKIGKDLHGFQDENNAHIFANNFVNEMIGNYSPNNKPAMFQGALGLPLGAFQTYMFNFYRRMYGMVERKDKAALFAQYAAQASVFGAKSVPGYSAWNSMFQSNQDGSDDFTSRMDRKLAPGVGELLLNGSLSNIPKIWGGLQADGLAFYSRGSVDFSQPFPTLLDMSKAPPMQFLANTWQMINKTATNVMSSSGFSLQQQEEIMAQFSTNRALKSIMELAANDITTRNGDIIQQGTRDAIHLAAAVLGTRPSSVRSAQDAMARQETIRLGQESLRSALTDHTQALFRSNDITVDKLQNIVHDYLNAGGNSAYLGQWFRNTFASATTPEVQKQLLSLGKSGKFLEFQDMLATLQQNQSPAQPQNNGVK